MAKNVKWQIGCKGAASAAGGTLRGAMRAPSGAYHYLGWVEAESPEEALDRLREFRWVQALMARGYDMVSNIAEPDDMFGDVGLEEHFRLSAMTPREVPGLLAP